MLVKQRITPTDYDRLIAFNQHNEGAHVDRTYLEGAMAYAHVRPEDPDRWVCTYVINKKPPYRCLVPLASAQQVKALKTKRIAIDQMAEITLLCRDRSLGWLPGEQQQFYTNSLIDGLKAGRRYLIGGTANPDLLPRLMTVLSNLLYEGQIDLFGVPKYGWVIYASWFGAIWNISRFMVKQWLAAMTPRRRGGTTSPLPNS
ncbi:hypothetical protein [Fibrella arboris]|uniref:hypothetical protein n=1 Tax=Fibrella arboris TaxID=3242486 RepID=UPI003521BC9B